MDIVYNKKMFKGLVARFIRRDGVDKLMSWLERSDFFVSPASTQYNLPIEGGLCRHSLNVAEALVLRYFKKELKDLTEEDAETTFENEMTLENILLVGLFSSIHKANCYVKDFKNVKVNGKWEQQEYWKWDEKFIYSGRGGKSVFILQQYMKLYVEEAQAIAFILAGEDNLFAGVVDTTYRKVYEGSNLALFAHLAELEATYYLDELSQMVV